MSQPLHVDHVRDALALRHFAAEKMQKVNLFETPQMFCDIYCLEPGQSQKVHAHAGAAKVYFVLEGELTAIVGDGESLVGAETAVLAPADEPHGLRNDSDARAVCLVFMAPNPNG